MCSVVSVEEIKWIEENILDIYHFLQREKVVLLNVFFLIREAEVRKYCHVREHYFNNAFQQKNSVFLSQ